ncbi:MAG: PAS domain-containing protein [Oscillochloris sp.]|nr:PAS domain-containing protein [Oscillochloris sp.]
MTPPVDLSMRLAEAEAHIEQLQAQVVMYQRVLDTLPLIVFWKDRESTFRGCNQNFAEMARIPSQAAIIGRTDQEMPWSGEQASAFRADDLEVMNLDRPKLRIIEPITRSDGSTRWLETNKIPLHDENDKVMGILGTIEDITERNAEEETRQAVIRELSTPLIPVTDDVVVMPLIGSIDSARAQQVIESLLEGIEQTRARIAIIDITGVPVVDTQVANALLRAAQAVRLLGTDVVLTGIRPEVAQTLVGLGADLSGIKTRGTLRSAITQALRLTPRT